jgi:hypothetical protein
MSQAGRSRGQNQRTPAGNRAPNVHQNEGLEMTREDQLIALAWELVRAHIGENTGRFLVPPTKSQLADLGKEVNREVEKHYKKYKITSINGADTPSIVKELGITL